MKCTTMPAHRAIWRLMNGMDVIGEAQGYGTLCDNLVFGMTYHSGMCVRLKGRCK